MTEGQASNQSSDGRAPSMPFLSPLTYDGVCSGQTGPVFAWDLTAACKPLLTAFHYISGKLACHGLHVALVVKSSRPEIIPAWPVGIQTQHLLAKFIQKANEKYAIDVCWLKAMLDLCKPIEAREIFESQRAVSYTVHRSIAQRDLIYSGEGLTVLAVDCIYILKGLLADLGGQDAIPLFRDDCKESCVELLHHVNTMYKDILLSRGYLGRAYTQFEYSEDVLEEVCEAYRAKFGKEGVFDMPITVSGSRKSMARKSNSNCIAEQLQASPRKIPEVNGSTTRKRAGQSARASLKGPQSVYVSKLVPPFQEPSTPVDAVRPDLSRPKSPKSSLFESPRSPPLTPPRNGRLRTMSKSQNLRAGSSNSQDSGTLVDQAETPPMRRIPSRKREFAGQLFGFALPNALPPVPHESHERHGKSVDLKRTDSLSRSRSLKPSPDIPSRASSTSRSIKSTISRYGFGNGLARFAPRRMVSEPVSKSGWGQPKPQPALRGEGTKFGWLQVMKKRNACAPAATAMVF